MVPVQEGANSIFHFSGTSREVQIHFPKRALLLISSKAVTILFENIPSFCWSFNELKFKLVAHIIHKLMIKSTSKSSISVNAFWFCAGHFFSIKNL